MSILSQYSWPGLYKPFEHQKVTAEFLATRQRAFCFNEAGCVDSETEYLSPTGWVKLSDYKGGKVAQFNPDTGMAEFVAPVEYIKLPCTEMIEFKSKYGIDQLLSPEHRVLHYKMDRNNGDSELFWRVDSAQSLHDRLHAKEISDVLFKTTYRTLGGTGIPLNEAELRLQIAVIADGYFGSNTNRCVVRVKRLRKVLRLKRLLADAKVEYKETAPEYAGAEGFHIFTFYAPLRVKVFDERFWAATPEQLRIVTDEVCHWDGSFRKSDGVAFYSFEKQSADFVQHAFVSQGKVARITNDGRGCWQVYVRNNARLIGISNRHKAPNARMVASTDGYKYCFTVPSTYLIFRRNGCVFVSGNSGKTSAAVWAADYLMNQGTIKRVLVICPLSIMYSAWQADIFRTAMHRTCGVAHGTPDKRAKIINGGYEFVVTNYEGVGVAFDAIAKAQFDLIIVDEANAYKSATTKRWKTLAKLITPYTWLWMMTGTPASQSPLDAFGLARMVSPSRVPKFASAWRDQVMVQISRFKWLPKKTAKDDVFAALQPAIRFTKDECLDLPDITYQTRDVPLSPQVTKYYKALKSQMLVEAAGENISAVNAAASLNKLLQISGGAVYSDQREIVEFDVSPRLNALHEVLDETDRKVVVFVPYLHTIDVVSRFLTDKGFTNAVIQGSVSPRERTQIIQEFQQSPDPRVLVIQPQSASHGVTLTEADTVVFWSPVMSVETYIQCIGRIDRVGQKHKMTVVHLQGSDAERRIYSMLQGKLDSHLKLVDLYKQELQSA